jgi:hypothetical protein
LTFPEATLLSGLFDEPALTFGGGSEHVDVKTGLALHGPYSLRGQAAGTLEAVRVGVVAPANLMTPVRQFLERLRGPIHNSGSEPRTAPSFPGFGHDGPFRCDLVLSPAWEETIPQRNMIEALSGNTPEERIARIVARYSDSIRSIAERTPRPDVIICVFEDDVVEQCGGATGPQRAKSTMAKSARVPVDQISLFATDEGEDNEESPWATNLRRALKAHAMPHGIPTQIVRERTLAAQAGEPPHSSGDLSCIGWNIGTALYYKAGGNPWRLSSLAADTCYVGISFFRDPADPTSVRTSLAQVFSHTGDGLILRGDSFEYLGKEKSPHLPEEAAKRLVLQVLELYERQLKVRPRRVVIHKSSEFWEDEQRGFEGALGDVSQFDLVAFGSRGIQFFRNGQYPPVRGSWVQLNDTAFLFTRGYVPFLRKYPGARVPRPLQMTQHVGDTPIDDLLREVLSLTKLNWNTADFSCSKPITLAFSQKVGEVLAQMPRGMTPQAEYRYYM